MKMEQRTFRIGELAKAVGVERFVIRFWEKEFGIQSHRSDGGQRFYTEHDRDTFQTIKDLLYEKKLTIAGARNELKRNSTNDIIASRKTKMLPDDLKTIYAKLKRLRELL